MALLAVALPVQEAAVKPPKSLNVPSHNLLREELVVVVVVVLLLFNLFQPLSNVPRHLRRPEELPPEAVEVNLSSSILATKATMAPAQHVPPQALRHNAMSTTPMVNWFLCKKFVGEAQLFLLVRHLPPLGM